MNGTGLFELRRTRSHTVILLVSAVDRRIVPALGFVSTLPCSDLRAVHVVVDPYQARRLAADWMDLGLSWLPLYLHDAPLREAVRDEAAGVARVTVVVPELQLPRWWQRHLAAASSRRVAAQLQPLSNVTTVIVPFALPG